MPVLIHTCSVYNYQHMLPVGLNYRRNNDHVQSLLQTGISDVQHNDVDQTTDVLLRIIPDAVRPESIQSVFFHFSHPILYILPLQSVSHVTLPIQPLPPHLSLTQLKPPPYLITLQANAVKIQKMQLSKKMLSVSGYIVYSSDLSDSHT